MITPAERRKAAAEQAYALLGGVDVPPGAALVVTGSLATNTMAPHSDIDALLLCEPGTEVSESLWYPLWESKLRVDTAVRTPDECAQVAASDITAALGMLEIKHFRGDAALTQKTRDAVLQQWRVMVRKNFEQILDTAIARWRRSGSVVSMTRPDIKHGRGGLRDIQLIQALALGNVCDAPQLESEMQLLLDVRTLLHHTTRRARDVLDPEFAVDIAIELGFEDRYSLATTLAHNARAIDAALAQALQQGRDLVPRRFVRAQPRKPIDVDVVEVAGEVALARNARVDDPWLPLRVGASSVRTGLPIAKSVWKQLEQAPMPPELWPKSAVNDFFAVLSSADHTIAVVRELDEHGHWATLVPWWDAIRDRMPREPIHIHTIDQHCLEVVALCAQQGVEVPRPDLLALAALFHDIGKGQNQPHEALGARYVTEMAARLQLPLRDQQVVANLVEQHTTIFQLLQHQDPEDPALAEAFLDCLHFDPLALQLMEVLVEADSKGTGPGVWTPMRAHSVARVCQAARSNLNQLCFIAPHIDHHVPLALIPDPHAENEATVQWSGEYLRAIVRVLALIAAKNWNITQAAVVVDVAGVRAEFQVRNHTGTAFDPAEFIQAYNSGVFSSLPTLDPGPVATAWQGDVLEVRTLDRRAALGACIGALPEVQWLSQQLRGGTMIAQCKLVDGFDRAKVERDVTRVLSNGYHGYVQP
ncbi:[protein-PII] uridylyltransferase [Corynebacterium pseudopelargi]|uniref:Bifunctional uridylyltransferase/uridylyl-removing enzyme n=1 Tax=Corynebacterium pseudopelargi TaxID=2080757 RepID=A0A3G6ITJ4_9CORY|nr:[protein-PII] uridylyltransferase [Corynebacterium pseudopelargi]AZA08993.1 Bifunctional uridylyltransferase/uridylyl-removing enzyme [Corynebacterium pseudopelargi]